MSDDDGVGQGDEGAWETATGWIPSGCSTHRSGERELLLRGEGTLERTDCSVSVIARTLETTAVFLQRQPVEA